MSAFISHLKCDKNDKHFAAFMIQIKAFIAD
jgi:hypothetical protein